jgi:hypothetical protein
LLLLGARGLALGDRCYPVARRRRRRNGGRPLRALPLAAAIVELARLADCAR